MGSCAVDCKVSVATAKSRGDAGCCVPKCADGGLAWAGGGRPRARCHRFAWAEMIPWHVLTRVFWWVRCRQTSTASTSATTSTPPRSARVQACIAMRARAASAQRQRVGAGVRFWIHSRR